MWAHSLLPRRLVGPSIFLPAHARTVALALFTLPHLLVLGAVG